MRLRVAGHRRAVAATPDLLDSLLEAVQRCTGSVRDEGQAYGFPPLRAFRILAKDNGILWSALGALFALACEPANCAGLLEAGSVQLLCAAVREEPLAAIAWAACGVLLKLASSASASASAAADAPSAVGAEAASAGATGAGGSAGSLRRRGRDHDAGELLASLMRMHSGDVRVTRAARAALAVLASSATARKALGVLGDS